MDPSHRIPPPIDEPDWIGIIGDPVRQVRAPALMNPVFAAAGRSTRVVPLRVAAADLQGFLDAAASTPRLRGLIVTLPHKVAAARWASHLSLEARRAGAANAIRFTSERRSEADLFDGAGFVAGLRAAGVEPRGLHAYLHGCGGVGAAIAMSLLAAGVSRLALFDVDAARASQLAARCRRHHPHADLRTGGAGDMGDARLLVNASPVGMRDDDPLPFALPADRPGTVVADVVMRGAPSRLICAARAAGGIGVPGEALLHGQLPLLMDFFGANDDAARA